MFCVYTQSKSLFILYDFELLENNEYSHIKTTLAAAFCAYFLLLFSLLLLVCYLYYYLVSYVYFKQLQFFY